MSINLTYTAASLADIADEFDVRAASQEATANTVRTQVDRVKYASSAATWQLAAALLRATTLKPAQGGGNDATSPV